MGALPRGSARQQTRDEHHSRDREAGPADGKYAAGRVRLEIAGCQGGHAVQSTTNSFAPIPVEERCGSAWSATW